MYGKNQSKQFLLPKLIEQLKTKNMIKIHNLDTKRDFVYLDDVIEAFIMSMKLKEVSIVLTLVLVYLFQLKK